MRTFFAVISGYVIFAGSAVLLFRLSHVDPHSPAAAGFEIFTIAYGVAFASVGGFVTSKLAKRTDLLAGIALAFVIALGATLSIIARPGAGAIWTQTAALVLFAPAALAADWARRRTWRAR